MSRHKVSWTVIPVNSSWSIKVYSSHAWAVKYAVKSHGAVISANYNGPFSKQGHHEYYGTGGSYAEVTFNSDRGTIMSVIDKELGGGDGENRAIADNGTLYNVYRSHDSSYWFNLALLGRLGWVLLDGEDIVED